MCGICGIYSESEVPPYRLEAMNRAVAHRGPDDEGYYLDGSIGLGSRRLSIIDLATGNQPISNEDGTIWIVYNGEIYNYQMLREALAREGHRFRTHSDTEVIVHLYEEYGEDCVVHLRGMFAFAIWDAPKRKLFLARDHLGQKPLFYAQHRDQFLFASEIKGILASELQPLEIDFHSLHHYLSLRFIPPPDTMFKGIQKLPPAHTLVYQDGQVRLRPYWELSFRDKLEFSARDWAEALREKISQAIEAHLVSDVPVGAFLSGGLDSSMIVAMMAKSYPDPFKTFAIGVEEQSFNELPYAREVAVHCGTNHIDECVQADLIQMLPEIIYHMDEPSDPIAACMYHAARLAAQHVKVVLGGDGGDELFAGFDRYSGLRYIDYYNWIPSLLRQKVIGPVLQSMPENFAYKSLTQRWRWTHHLSLSENPAMRYAQATCFFRFCHEDKRALFQEHIWQKVKDLDSSYVIADAYDHGNADHPIDRMLFADYVTRLPEHSLMLTDRMTMAHGLEARSPFLDRELVEFLAAFPPDLKIRNGQLKYGLRQVAHRYLPARITSRGKQGFMFPVAYWFRSQLYPLISSLLPHSFFVQSGVFNPDYVIQLIEEHRAGLRDHHVRLWMLLNLEVWHRIYFQGQDPAEVSALLEAAVG